MKFSKPYWSIYPMLNDWNSGDHLYHFDYMPGGAFGLYIVEATNSKSDKESQIASRCVKILFESPSMFHHEVGSDFNYNWPTSYYEDIPTLVRVGIKKAFDSKTIRL